jgi:hypothetical protein
MAMDWISVHDKLPEDGKLVLMWLDNQYAIGFLTNDPNVSPGKYWETIDAEDYYRREEEGIETLVKFWMPLPAPPKGERLFQPHPSRRWLAQE